MNIETWNKHYPVGTDVFFRVDHCEECHSVTASRAWTREDGTDVVKLQGVEGDFEFELSRLRPETIKHDIKHRETHHHPFGQMEQLPLNELLDMMASHGVAKVASVFSNQDDRPVFAVVLLTGEHIQDYLDAFDRIGEEPTQPKDSAKADAAARLAVLEDVWKRLNDLNDRFNENFRLDVGNGRLPGKRSTILAMQDRSAGILNARDYITAMMDGLRAEMDSLNQGESADD
ncbi:MAG TPA: hypothetical protein DCS18_16385 [Alcanivorax sp.]|jgi:hypothetical protein|nr:hypothetical protein [Alcanivorax sp.]HAV68690.1 hypothetical protein [Alcanivorax sp.]|tara:strand:- start:72397 stop:73089 length:693 start_codon:yes stop_codon:yes gene_type:complete